MITHLAVGVKAYLIYILNRREFDVVLHESWKNRFFSYRFHGFQNCDLRTDPFNGFLLTSSSFVQKATYVRLSKYNFFCSNNVPEIHIFNFSRHQKLLLVANQLQDSTFYLKPTIWT